MTSFACGGCEAENDPPPDFGLPIFTFEVRATPESEPVEVHAEVASTSAQRQTGLMNRPKMSAKRGMFFIFPKDVEGGFWMKNTILPLTIAYIGVDGTVQELRTGVPYDDQNILKPAKPYRYVLEVNKGWFERNGLGVGSVVTIPEGLPVPE